MKSVQKPDIALLSMLLSSAKGNRTQAEYADAAGVARPLFSRILRGERRPSPETLRKLTSENAQPQNGITFEELMVAAGHARQSSFSKSSDASLEIEDTSKKDAIYRLFIEETRRLVLEELHDTGWEAFSADTSTGTRVKPNTIIKLEPDGRSKIKEWWLINMRGIKQNSSKLYTRPTYVGLAGKHIRGIQDLVELPPDDERKISLVYSNESEYEAVIDRLKDGVCYRGNFSLILIDLEADMILDEKYISTYYDDNFYEPKLF